MMVDTTFAIVIIGLLVAGVELFSLVSRELDLVCLGFILVVGGLMGVFSGSFFLGFVVIICLGIAYFSVFRKTIHKWIRDASRP